MHAEIVLLGVSRTFKTPLSVYMAYKGWLVGNIPIVPDMPLPEIIYKLPPERVFCLVTNATALSRLRNVRNEYLKGLVPKYASYDNVKQELRYANYLFSTQPNWAKIKVTAKPIEEINEPIDALAGLVTASNSSSVCFSPVFFPCFSMFAKAWRCRSSLNSDQSGFRGLPWPSTQSNR